MKKCDYLFFIEINIQMGIKGLNKFLRKECPEAFVELPNTFFNGKRIAIDSDNLLMKFMCRAHKDIVDRTDVAIMEPDREEIIKRWIYHVKNFVLKWLKIGATPIFVFDGKYIKEKSKTQKKRRADKKKMILGAETLKAKIMSIDPLERTPAMITSLRKKMHHLGFVTSDDKEIMRGILSSIGIPVLRATEEGEKLCAMLCIEGKVDAAFSRDTDLVALGCPLTINEPAGYTYNQKTNRTEECVKCTLFKPILSALEFEYKSFLDLCIMSGCDFNDNIPQKGIVRSFRLLKNCKFIDNLPAEYNDRIIEYLNHPRCRQIFSRVVSSEISQDPIILNINKDLSDSRDRLEMYGADDWLLGISDLYNNLPIPSDVFIFKPPTLVRSRVRLNVTNIIEVEKPPAQKSSPKYINNKTILSLNKNQHKRFLKKYPHLAKKSYPVLNIVDK